MTVDLYDLFLDGYHSDIYAEHNRRRCTCRDKNDQLCGGKFDVEFHADSYIVTCRKCREWTEWSY